MKMMNEVAAQRAGTIQSVHVEAGQTVEAGSPLVAFVDDEPQARVTDES